MALPPRDAAMLAFLALEGPTTRTRMAALLWPDRGDDMARNALRQRLFQLRRRVACELVVGTDTLSLTRDVTHDLDTADSVLGDAPHAYSAEFVAWLGQQRQRRHDRLRQSLVDLCEMAERAGDWADALVHASELLATDPVSEAAHRRLIRLHYLADDRAAALLAFDRCEQVLKNDVGVAPSPQTLELLQTIERSEPSARQAPGSSPRLIAPKVPVSVLRPPQCVGREAVWTVLCQARDAGRVVLLAGEAGMGKSRLLSDLANPGPGTPPEVLVVAARPGDAAVPYASLGRCARLLLRDFRLLRDPVARQVLARVLPELGDPAPMTRDDDRARLVQALDALLRSAVDCGLRAFVVDDLQFADDASIELLAPLIAAGHSGWILAMRPDELSAAGRALVDGLGRGAQVQMVNLQPLDRSDIVALLDSLAIAGIGGQAQAESLRRRTGGNPLFLLETLKAALTAPTGDGSALVAQPGPSPLIWPSAPNVVRLIQQRLARLSPLALRVARCAAVAGQDLSAPLVAQVLGLRPLDLIDAWAELEGAQVLRDTGFVHDLIAEAASAAVPDAIARALHGEIAMFLEQGQGGPAQMADHWVAAGQPLRAVPHLEDAGMRARDAWCFREAAAFYRRAANILRQAGQRRAAFDAFAAEAEALTEIALDQGLIDCGRALRELADDEGQRAVAALVDVLMRVETRRLDEARQVALEALPLAQAAGLPDIEAELLWILVMIHWERREVADAVRLTERAIELLRSVDAATSRLRRVNRELRMTHGLGVFFAAAGRYEQSSAQFVEVHRQAGLTHDLRHMLDAADALANNAIEQGDLAEALRWSGEAVAGLDRIEVISGSRAAKDATRATALAADGELGAALAMFDRVAQLCDEGTTRMRAQLMVRRHLLYFELGRRDLAAMGLRLLHARTDLSAIERTLIAAAQLSIGEAADGDAVLEQVGAIDDLRMRVRVLCLAQPGCEPARVLPLLGISLAAARESGAHGMWLGLQVRRVAALRGAGRAGEAVEAALAAWQRMDSGIVGSDLFPRMAAELCAVMSGARPDLAQTIALRASGWMHRAASTLPPGWREAYLMRGVALPWLPGAALPAPG